MLHMIIDRHLGNMSLIIVILYTTIISKSNTFIGNLANDIFYFSLLWILVQAISALESSLLQAQRQS